MKKDTNIISKRKRLWNTFGWVFNSDNYLSKNHSLNCGCSMCRTKTYFRRLGNKQERLKARNEIKKNIP